MDPCHTYRTFIMVCVAVLLGCTEESAPGLITPVGTAETHITWSGYRWIVKQPPYRTGPGDNYFSNELVHVDADDRLHLRIARVNGVWCCSEVILDTSLGYGSYIFRTESRIDTLPPWVTLGLFTYSHRPEWNHREIDIEYGRWQKTDDSGNAQFCVQSYEDPRRLHRYHLDLCASPHATHLFEWREERVVFACVRGHAIHPFDEGLVASWTFAGEDIPVPLDERCRVNLWLYGNPRTEDEVEVILSGFEFVE